MRILLAPLLLLSSLAEAENCLIALNAGDDMKFDRASVAVSSSCENIEVAWCTPASCRWRRWGTTSSSSRGDAVQAVATEGMKAGAGADYLPADDARVIAHTRLVGGGETAQASFAGNKLAKGGSYAFFAPSRAISR